jgi:hypothetical protein
MSKPEFVYVIYIQSTAEKTWNALSISKGWQAIMSSLKSLLESGRALDVPLAALGIEGVE